LTKRETWEWIKANEPKMAQFIMDLSEQFGRLQKVELYVLKRTSNGR